MKNGLFEKMRNNKLLVKIVVLINLFFQITFPVAVVFTPVMAGERNMTLTSTGCLPEKNDFRLPSLGKDTDCRSDFPDEHNGDQQIASYMQQGANLLVDKNAGKQLTGMATQALGNSANDEINRWLHGAGTVRLGLNVDDHFSLKNTEFDLLFPLWERSSDMIYTQNSLHRSDDRTQSNLGLGLRHFSTRSMIGVNTFLDYDWSERQARTGLGLEYWRDFLKLSANRYQRLTNWKDSHTVRDYQARPANGWDIRTQSYLPFYPQLGLALSWEQYYGRQVSLFGKDNRQRDPHALSGKLTYTPVPLLTFNAEHRSGKSGASESRFGLDMNYQIGMPLKKQLDHSEVAALRTLGGSRYDLVDRNNDIVLDYRKKEVIRLTLDKLITGYGGEQKPLHVAVTAKYGLKEVQWSAERFIQNGGVIHNDTRSWRLTLPPYQPGPEGNNTYMLTAVAFDGKNNASPSATVQVSVLPSPVSAANSTIEPTKSRLPADGRATQVMTLKLRDAGNNLLTIPQDDIRITTSTQTKTAQTAKISPVKQINPGQYQFTVTAGTQEEVLNIIPQIRELTLNSAEVAMVTALVDESQSTLTITPNTLAANGTDRAEVIFTPKNSKGETLTGLKNVIFQIKGDNKATVSLTTVEEKNGHYHSWIGGTQAGDITVSPIVGQQHMTTPQASVHFIGDSATANVSQLEADKLSALADGQSPITLTATVTDAHGNPVANVPVSFTTDSGVLSNSKVMSNSQGHATTQISNTRAVSATVSASAGTLSPDKQIAVTFTADTSTPTISALIADRENAPANGVTPVTLSATVQDANGNPLAGQKVLFTADSGTLNITDALTDSRGVARTLLTSLQAETVSVTARTETDTTGKTKAVRFIADNATALVSQLEADRPEATANGQSAITLTATVTDAHGNRVSGESVNFATSLGQLAAQQAVTDEHGEARIALLSFEAGPATITATSANDRQGKTRSVQFLPDTSNAIVNTIDTDRNDAIADGRDSIAVTVKITDPNNNPVAGIAVKMAAPAGLLSPATAISDAKGHVQATLTSKTAGDIVITATTASDPQGKTHSVHFSADATTAAITELSADKLTAIADDADTITLTAKLTDVNNNPVANGVVIFATAQGHLSAAEATTNAEGKAQVKITSTSSGIATVSATAATDAHGKRLDLRYVANPATAIVESLTSSVDRAPADDVSAITFTATLKDAYGNPVQGQPLSFTTSGGRLSSATAITDANGHGRIQLTSARSGDTTVTATSASDSSGKQKTVLFEADASTATIHSLTANRTSAIANGSDAITLTATVNDAQGNPTPGVVITFKPAFGALSAPQGTTDQQGQVSVTLSSTQSGDVAVMATTATDPTGKSLSLRFDADASSAVVVSLNTDKMSAPADGKTAISLTASVKDAHGNAVPAVQVHFSNDKGRLSASDVMTDSHGLASVALTSTQDGPLTIAATTPTDPSGQRKKVTFTADASTATIASLTTDHNALTANGKSAATLTATVKDANGNLVPDMPVIFTTSRGELSASQQKTNAQGEAQITLTGTEAGAATVKAAAASDPLGKTMLITFSADAATAAVVGLAADRTQATANGSALITLTATVADAFNNPVAGQTVSFVSDLGLLSTASAVTDDRGQAQIEISSTRGGTATIVASHVNNPKGKRINVTFTADNATAKVSVLSADKTTAAANGRETIVLRAEVMDNNGNRVPATNVSFSTSGGTLSANQAVTDPQGVASVQLTAIHMGDVTVTAKASADSSGKSTTLTFVADNTTATVRSLTADRPEATANGKMTIAFTALLTDANNNPVAGETISFENSGGHLSQANAITDSNGNAQVTLNSLVAAPVTIKATSATDATGKSTRVNFVADKTTAAIASLTADRDMATADGRDSISLTALVQDGHGNPVEGSVVTFTTAKGTLQPKQAITDSAGLARTQITSLSSGPASVNATSDTDKKGQTRTLTFSADNATARVVSLIPDSKTSIADGKQSIMLTAVLKDANGNLVPDTPITFTSNSGVLSGGSIKTNSQGVASVALTSVTATAITVHATSDSDPQGQQASVMFNPDASTAKLSALTADRPTALADGKSAIAFTAIVADAHNNPVPDISVSFSTSKGTLTATSSMTNARGEARIELSSLQSGQANVSATTVQDTAGISINVNFNADAATAKIVSLTTDRPAATANGKEQVIISAMLEDINGNPVPGIAVSLATTLGNLSAGSALTNPAGVAQVTLNSTLMGKAIVSATSPMDSTGKQREVLFNADVTTARIADLTASAPQAVADGVEAIILTATLKDALGNPVAATALNYSSPLGSLDAKSVITNAQGIAQTRIISTKAGATTVTVTSDTDKVGKSTDLSFTANAATARVAKLMADTPNATADGKSAITLTAILRDANGNLVSGAPVSFATTRGDLNLPQAKTNDKGEARVTLTSTEAGSAQVNAKSPQESSGLNVTVTFTADSATASIVTLDSSAASAIADGSAFVTLTATVEDKNGNRVANAQVSFTTNGGMLAAKQVTTNQDGKAIVTLSSTTSGTYTIGATLSQDSSGKTLAVSFIADVKTATVSLLVPDSVQATADGKSAITLTATVKDAHGNRVPAVDLAFSASAGQLDVQNGQSDTNGEAHVVLTSTLATDITVTAKTTGEIKGKTSTVNFAADLATAHVIALDTDSTSIVANGTALATLTVTVEDAWHNRVPNAPVTLGSSLGTLANTLLTTDAHGQAQTTLSGLKAGNAQISAQRGHSDTGKSASIELTADIATARIASFSADKNTSVVSDTAGVVLSAKVVDANGNPVNAQNVTFTSSESTIAPLIGNTDSSGQTTVTLINTLATALTVKATVATDAVGKDLTLIFTPDKPSKVHSYSKTEAEPGEELDWTLSIQDQYGNDVPNQGLIFTSVVVTNKRGVTQPSLASLILIDGNNVNKRKYITDAKGQLTVKVRTSYAGYKYALTISAGGVVASKDIIFYTLTSPDSDKAFLFGHMPETITVGGVTFKRPPLKAESNSYGQYVANEETWASDVYTTAAKYCTLPTTDELVSLVKSGEMAKNGWPKPTYPAFVSSTGYAVNVNTATSTADRGLVAYLCKQ